MACGARRLVVTRLAGLARAIGARRRRNVMRSLTSTVVDVTISRE
jgi:hypothetical protein